MSRSQTLEKDWLEHELGLREGLLERELIFSVLRKSGGVGHSWQGKQQVQRPCGRKGDGVAGNLRVWPVLP